MSRQKYRGNVIAADFPLLSTFSGQSVVVPQIDQNYNRGLGETQHHLVGTPQAIFLENVMPMTAGLQSVSFEDAIIATWLPNFDRAFYLMDGGERATLFVPANGFNYTYNFLRFRWRAHPMATPPGADVTIANLKQRCFVCYESHSKLLEWDGRDFHELVLTGLDQSAVKGICAAGPYLIAYTEDTVYWSSIEDPTDFVPALETGAGSTNVLALNGKILVCTSISNGFLIWTSGNTVNATLTGNIRFPFNFVEISGSAGINDTEKITRDTSSIYQYAHTVAGLMVLDRSKAIQTFPEVSEFLAGRRIEAYNYTTKEIEQTDLSDAMFCKVASIGERYLVISYGDGELTQALIFDIALKRWGKVRIDHVDAFEYLAFPYTLFPCKPAVRYNELVGSYAAQGTRTYASFCHLVGGPPVRYIDIEDTYEDLTGRYVDFGGLPSAGLNFFTGQEAYKSIGFLQRDGLVKVVNFDLPVTSDESVLYLGRYQLIRNRFLDIFEIWAEQVGQERQTVLSIIPSMDGYNNMKRVYLLKDKKITNGKLTKWFANISALSYIISFEGNFDLSSIEIVFDSAGYR